MKKNEIIAIVGCVVFILITLALIFLGCYYDVYFLLVLGSLAIISILSIFSIALSDSDDGCGCLVFVLVLIAIIIMLGGFNDRRYIARSSWRFHKYADCEAIDYNDIYNDRVQEVSKLEGFYHLVFKECDVCKERKQEEIRERWLMFEQQEREDLIEYFKGIISLLEDGQSLVDEVKSKIMEDLEIDTGDNNEDEDYSNIPSRYR